MTTDSPFCPLPHRLASLLQARAAGERRSAPRGRGTCPHRHGPAQTLATRPWKRPWVSWSQPPQLRFLQQSVSLTRAALVLFFHPVSVTPSTLQGRAVPLCLGTASPPLAVASGQLNPRGPLPSPTHLVWREGARSPSPRVPLSDFREKSIAHLTPESAILRTHGSRAGLHQDSQRAEDRSSQLRG